MPKQAILHLLQQEIVEKELLLSITRAFSVVRYKDEILEKITPELSKLFNSEDIFICQIDQTAGLVIPYLRTASLARSNDPKYKEVLDGRFPIKDRFFLDIRKSIDPLHLDLEEMCNWHNAPEYGFISRSAGIQECISTVIRNSDGELGILTIWSDKRGNFQQRHLVLLQRVADQLAMVLSTLENREIIRRWEKENSVLLKISNELAGIRDKTELTQVLNRSLREFIPYAGAVILTYDKSSQKNIVYSYMANQELGNHPGFLEFLEMGCSVVKETISDPVLPEVFKLPDLRKKGGRHVELLAQSGIQEIATIKLIDGDQLIGIMVLLSESLNLFTASGMYILQYISFQFSVAVAKLLVLDEISQRKKEKELLLNIGYELSAVREKEELLPLLKRQLDELGFYNDVSIAKVDNNGKTFSRFLTDEKAGRQHDPEYADMVDAHHSFPDGVFEKVLYSRFPVMFDLDELVAGGNSPSYINFIHRNGIYQMAGVPLRNRNREIGVLFLFSPVKRNFSQPQTNLVSGIAHLLGTVIANILANEEIKRQLIEINQYKEQLEEEKLYLQQEVSRAYSFQDIIGSGAEMQNVFTQLKQVASANSTVLILGETGTGKELIARAIHNSSSRSTNLMVKLNCAALPPTLIESELFGHEKGSFTGAHERRIGKFELANNGTLFLDEIGEMPITIQVKLLRALQEREIDRIGGKNPIKINVRIIAASNRDLLKEVEEGRFREDLYYRLNVFPILLPPLRKRKEDIPLLTSYFLDKYSKNTGKPLLSIAAKAIKALMAYSWPGNIRELEHLIERTVLITTGTVIKEVHLPSGKTTGLKNQTEQVNLKTHEENERDHILQVLNQCDGKIYGIGGAAAILNLPVSTLNSKIKKLGIRRNSQYS